MSDVKKTNGNLLKELVSGVATITERINNSISKNDEDHKEIKETLKDIRKISGDEIKDVRDRLKVLEDKKIEFSTTAKFCLFLLGLIPTIITILRCFGYI